MNTHQQVTMTVKAGLLKRQQAVYITHLPKSIGYPPRAQVVGVYFATDPDSHWTNHNKKTFYGNSKMSRANAAIDWASQQYGITEWARNALGDHVPKVCNTKFPIT